MLSMLLARLISSSLLSETIAHQDVPLISDAHCMRLEGVIRFRPSDMGKLSALLFLSTVANESPECSPEHITAFRIGLSQNRDIQFDSESWPEWRPWDATLTTQDRKGVPQEYFTIDYANRSTSQPASFVVQIQSR